MAADIKKEYLDRYKQESSALSGTKLDKNKFKVSITQYPSDLQTADNLKHYVLFNINIRGKSKFNESKVLFETKRNPSSANLSKDELASPSIRGVTYAAAGVAAGVAVTSLASTVAKAAGKTGAKVETATKVAGTVAGGAVAIGMANSDILKKDTTYRISDAIALYVDGPPTVKYSMNYANKELGTLLGALAGGVMQNIKGLGGEAGAALGASLAKLPGAFGGADVASALSSSSGTSLNPFKETVFESVDFRSFAFKYKFFPKNKTESDAVFNIINTFKFHMHPEMSESKLFFIYPSEFDISYYYGNVENGYFHKFATCALESMDVNYGGEQFSSFRDGSPTEINMSLTFRELEIITKKMITEGY
jgi:hypothetical protein